MKILKQEDAISPTIAQWLEMLPEQIAERALRNAKHGITFRRSGLHTALMSSFSWSDTPEGIKYWNSLDTAIKHGQWLKPFLQVHTES